MLVKKIGLFIPTLNAGDLFHEVLKGISVQNLDIPIRKLIIDSGSKDETTAMATRNGFEVVEINKSEFNHGGTRNLAVEILDDCEIIVMMTQDVIIENASSIKELLSEIMSNDNVFMAYGRQIADDQKGNWFEKRARLFNYPPESMVKSISDVEKLGVKTVFASNAFAAYNVEKFKAIGGFPSDVNFSEDMFIAARGVLSGYSISYESKATVLHTHSYSLKEEYRRYMEIGKFHKNQKWIQEAFGRNEGEGIKSVINELVSLISEGKIYLIFHLLLLNLTKYAGYKKGVNYGD
ncbi:glycosyltransferase family 2 protein [Exiguobacterium sp. SH0S2]|uniref:glycosyltransferase family 2 protein n=1 Tax=Exiguobacterium sp. SH0S2 TaxID=2510950 RepID=UPI0013764776|nr:glycosyltransferase family 2 protein [Exiguobacterium sp. SH0S2]